MSNTCNCWFCGAPLIWGCDHDLEDITGEKGMYTNLNCSGCGALAEFTKVEEE